MAPIFFSVISEGLLVLLERFFLPPVACFFLNLLNLTARAIENSDFKAEY